MYVPMLGNVFETLHKTYVISKKTSINVGFGKKTKIQKKPTSFQKKLMSIFFKNYFIYFFKRLA